MKKLIGGLLVLAIFTCPTLSNIDYVSYEIYRLLNQKQVYIIVEPSEESNSVDARKIDEAMDSIDSNARYISDLLKEREELLAKIEAKMDLHSYARSSLTEAQIGSFINFTNYTRQSKQELNEVMKQIDENKSLMDVAKEILHIDTDYKFVYDELSNISKYQGLLIDGLNEHIHQGRTVLDII